MTERTTRKKQPANRFAQTPACRSVGADTAEAKELDNTSGTNLEALDHAK